MAAKKQSKAVTPIERAARVETREDLAQAAKRQPSRQQRRLRRAARIFNTTSDRLAVCDFVPIGRVGACGGIYPHYYVSHFEQTARGRRVRACICDDCNNVLRLHPKERELDEHQHDAGEDLSAEIQKEDRNRFGAAVVRAVAELLIELEEHGQFATPAWRQEFLRRQPRR